MMEKQVPLEEWIPEQQPDPADWMDKKVNGVTAWGPLPDQDEEETSGP